MHKCFVCESMAPWIVAVYLQEYVNRARRFSKYMIPSNNIARHSLVMYSEVIYLYSYYHVLDYFYYLGHHGELTKNMKTLPTCTKTLG